jgi:hypothetical protein
MPPDMAPASPGDPPDLRPTIVRRTAQLAAASAGGARQSDRDQERLRPEA